MRRPTGHCPVCQFTSLGLLIRHTHTHTLISQPSFMLPFSEEIDPAPTAPYAHPLLNRFPNTHTHTDTATNTDKYIHTHTPHTQTHTNTHTPGHGSRLEGMQVHTADLEGGAQWSREEMTGQGWRKTFCMHYCFLISEIER